MTDQMSKQARINALKQDIASLKAENITDDQLARMTEIINEASVQNYQHTGVQDLAEKFFQTENLIKTLQSNIAGLQQSDLLINNEMHLLEMQKQLIAAQNNLEALASLISKNQEQLAHFKDLDSMNHLDLTKQLHDQAQALNL
ncbi:MAG: hypothetical protein EOO69_10280 [Moraxellaceae bacterium]|nr:MAG: hypothetical protein EOO69_10280 [Moraxellaceae bacterium]